jgi:hypothetical protein
MAHQAPLPLLTAWASVGRCVVGTAGLLAARRVHQRVRTSDSGCASATGQPHTCTARPFIDRPTPSDPTVLMVGFRLRAVRGRGHAVFRPMSLLNTPLFVGFTSGTELSKPRLRASPVACPGAGQRSGHHPLPCAARSAARRSA